MSGKSFQCAFRHGVDRERCSQTLDVKNVGGLRVLGPCAGPQQALRTSAKVVDTLPKVRAKESAHGFVGAFRHGNAKLVMQLVRRLVRDGAVPAADEYGGDGGYIGIESGRDTPLDAAQERLGRRKIMLAGKQQRDIDRYAGEDRLLDRREAFLRSGNLDSQVGTRSPRKQILCSGNSAGRVV